MNDEITHEIEFGQVYKDARTDELIQLIYLDKNIFVLQNESEMSHRIGKYQEFHENVKSGRYEYQPDEQSFASTGVLNKVRELMNKYQSEDSRTASHKAEALSEALDLLTDIGSDDQLENIPFEDLDGIGEKAASNLRRAGYENCGDIWQASDEELTDVDWVGDKGVESIRAWCE